MRSPQKGQIAHLKTAAQSGASDLVYLCLNHHDDFDSRSSQSKGITAGEVRAYRDRLYVELGTESVAGAGLPSTCNAPTMSVNRIANQMPGIDEVLKLPWRSVWQSRDGPELFAFKSPNRFDGVCRVERIELDSGRTAIVVKEISENPGMSVTNAIEWIARQLTDCFEADPRDVVWLEHYDTWFAKDDEWNRVTFKSTPPGFEFEAPSWMPMTEEDWRTLGIRPRMRRTRRGSPPQSTMVKIR